PIHRSPPAVARPFVLRDATAQAVGPMAVVGMVVVSHPAELHRRSAGATTVWQSVCAAAGKNRNRPAPSRPNSTKAETRSNDSWSDSSNP
ncbi:MAG: hypothetical protein M3256_10590, partial [Actinomycetota bacterium]|nr:hypothetical protein [Actinomycetota bacterium]